MDVDSKIFADWSYETFRGNKFHGSTILDGCTHFSKHFAELNFRGSRRIRKHCKFMRLENLALYGIAHVICVSIQTNKWTDDPSCKKNKKHLSPSGRQRRAGHGEPLHREADHPQHHSHAPHRLQPGHSIQVI